MLNQTDDMVAQLIRLSLLSQDDLPEDALLFARASLLDWLICGRAGRTEPVANKLRQYAQSDTPSGCSSVFGGTSTSPRLAAMVNGAISHALDYDLSLIHI